MGIILKPEIYISWIPRGQIEVKPEIYASIILAPHLETISADTSRKIKNFETATVDTLRKVGNVETVQGDLFRKINKTENNFADTFRQVGKLENIFADSSRVINFSENISADTQRKVSNIEKIIGDTLREVETNFAEIVADTLIRNGCSENISADSLRKVVFDEKIIADTFRKINQSTEIIADTLIKNACSEIISADTKRITSNIEKIFADTEIVITNIERIVADTERNIFEFISADTYRQIVKTEKIVADTNKRIPHKLIYSVDTPLMKNILKDKNLKNAPSLINTFKDYGVTSINITLQEKTLSDTFQFGITHALEINDAVTGKLLDYEFNFLVEETNQQDLNQSVKGMYDKDELLYTRIKMPENRITYVRKKKNTGYTWTSKITNIIYYSAVVILETLADTLGLETNIKIGDFIPYNIEPNCNMPYNSYISNLFGWTSRVPQRQINVFIRGGVLHCIQRGMEESVFDISDLPHSRPVVNKKLLRTMWNANDYEKEIEIDDDENDPVVEYEYEDVITPFSGVISYSDSGTYHSLTYSNGLLVSDYTSVSNDKQESQSRTDYNYTEKFPEDLSEIEIFINKIVGDFYMSSKTTNSYTYQKGNKTATAGASTITDDKKIYFKSVTTYTYSKTGDDIFLLEESESETKETYTQEMTINTITGATSTKWKLTDSESNYRQTFHEPIGNGWYGQSVYLNGEPQGSNISQGKPGNKVTQYTLQEVQKKLKGIKITIKLPDKNKDKDKPTDYEDQYKEWRRQLAPITDITFPVREFEKLFELTTALKNLDRKIQEEISVDIIDNVVKGVPSLLHIIDFTERIKLDGAEYFLVSNNISFTPTKFIQKLRLIRWY